MVVVAGQRALDVVDISTSFAVLALGDVAGRSTTPLDFAPLNEIEVDDILADGLTIRAFDFEVPISVLSAFDYGYVLKLTLYLQVNSSHLYFLRCL